MAKLPNNINCPKCGHSFPIDEALFQQVKDEMKASETRSKDAMEKNHDSIFGL